MELNKFHRYINLDCRPDRNTSCRDQLSQIGILVPQRFSAYKTTDGIIGCGMSHLTVLKQARDNNYPYILICEDDVVFSSPEILKNKIDTLYNWHEWDVLLLGGNMDCFVPLIHHSENAYRIHKCFTTTAYIVKRHYYDTLIDCWEKAMSNLIKDKKNNNYFLDVAWFPLQRKDKWLLVKPLQVHQRAGYSDIEKRDTDYKDLMLSTKH
jgi:GR25 family glycosyltransferase involved in LPS biosynthesis